MIDKQDVIVSLLKGIDLNIENLGETDVLLSNRITTLENSVKTINTGINDINTTNTTQTANITSNTNKIDTTNTNVSNLTTRVTDVENKATTNESNLNTLNERVTTLENAEPSGGGGYPVVTVTEDFNIEAQPNTFYNIKNSADSEVTINCSEGYSVDGKGKHIMFTFDDWEDDDMGSSCAYFGGFCVSDTSKEGYKYKMELDMTLLSGGQMTGIITAYFSDEVKTGNSVTCLFDAADLGLGTIIISMNNIQVLTDNIDYLVWVTITLDSTITTPHIFTEVENDNQEYQHKYAVWGQVPALLNAETFYTNEPYTTATSFYLADGTDIFDLSDTFQVNKIEVKPNIFLPSSDIANEFVFNINSPANITFNQAVKWNNNTAPDLTQTGICTISIVNGVGCYTFV